MYFVLLTVHCYVDTVSTLSSTWFVHRSVNISAAWAVDREFVHILGPSGTFRISCGMILNSFCSLGCALGAPGVLRGASEARDEFSKFVWESELSTSAYSDNIWPTGKISKKSGQKHMCFSVES